MIFLFLVGLDVYCEEIYEIEQTLRLIAYICERLNLFVYFLQDVFCGLICIVNVFTVFSSPIGFYVSRLNPSKFTSCSYLIFFYHSSIFFYIWVCFIRLYNFFIKLIKGSTHIKRVIGLTFQTLKKLILVFLQMM